MDPSLSLEQRRWLAIAGLAILWHLLLFATPWQRILPEMRLPLAPPRVELKDVSSEELAKIRQQWKEKKLLLGDDAPAPESPAPPDARYQSDRNRRVEREQQARNQDTVPAPGAAPRPAPAPVRAARRVGVRSFGVPFFASRPRDALPQPSMPRGETERPRMDQSLLEKQLPYGAENMLNTEQTIYYSFYSRLYQAIAPIWQSKIREVPAARRVPPGEYAAAADVSFDEEGNLLEVRILQASGIPEFDQAIHEAWRAVGRFPNPPRDLLGPGGVVHTGWTFTVVVDQNFNWHSGGPRRY